ncbi:tetratricopeptide repeat protein [Sulfurovum mangrovi]|uniref:tetratricopeptide repeat protein n=1 Tax=Sulfurovum mangrovi TaxID=2893889 RepID=UPI001E5775C1|nr:hypothetical protein [Sulfurovum mangrovi]UFH59953.1 hypothetical protein LN246_03680 [Sulfurovum mangrovi]
MNQTQKRLSIIKLAISMTDIETIQQQISKLRLLKEDLQIQKIIDALESESYAQAQNLIQAYIDAPIQEVHQRVSNGKQEESYSRREQELIDQFDLFITDNHSEEKSEIVDINQYLKRSRVASNEKKDPSEVDFDKLLEMDESEPMETEVPLSSHGEATVSESDKEPQEPLPITDTTSEDTFLAEEVITAPLQDESFSEETTEESLSPQEEESETTAETVTAQEKETVPSKTEDISGDTVDREDDQTQYRPIFSIREQFHDASEKYPPVTSTTQLYDSVEQWIDQISDEHGYKKTDVEKTVIEALKLAEEAIDSKGAEAAELLLLSGLTEDAFGQLILARELFKGRLFEKNIAEAFERIEQLAEKEYPEAICDLAQFYEHGIGTQKNRKKAKALYKEAMQLGIKRAQKHFERLNKERGLFSF